MRPPTPLPAGHDRSLVFCGTTPCDIWIGAERRYCGDKPTRYFAQGHRCARHTPAAVEARAAKAAIDVEPTVVPESLGVVDDYTPTREAS